MISVVLCTYNGARFVGEQVESILRQVPAPGELVLGDDASTDDTVALVERLAAEHGVALVVRRHETALGVRGNFADALQHASGDLIALSDQDDIWHDGKLARLEAAFAVATSSKSKHSSTGGANQVADMNQVAMLTPIAGSSPIMSTASMAGPGPGPGRGRSP